MGDLIQIVDAVSATPTVQLDLNDEVTWSCPRFSAPAPRLRRSVSVNAMRDGIHEGSSTYDSRVLALTLEVKTASQDANATEIQKLARQLDRSDRFLKYQPTGATKPVFFKLFRSDTSAIDDVLAQVAMRRIEVELLADPFALGLRETLGPFTVNNDPAAASNGCFFDVTGVVGDVAAPALLIDTTAVRYAGVLATRAHGTPANVTHFAQAEGVGLSTDTTNPGGGPDAAMSGTGTNNFVRTSFASPTMRQRLVWTPPSGVDNRGPFVIYAVVRRSDATSDMAVALGSQWTSTITPKVALPKSVSRILVRVGIDGQSEPAIDRPGGLAGSTAAAPRIEIQAERTSGTGTLDWDALFRIPVDRQMLTWNSGDDMAAYDMVIDAANESMYMMSSGVDILTGGAVQAKGIGASGGFPSLVPNQTNRIYLLLTNTVNALMDKTVSDSIAVHYWPRYVYVRPSAS